MAAESKEDKLYDVRGCDRSFGTQQLPGVAIIVCSTMLHPSLLANSTASDLQPCLLGKLWRRWWTMAW